MPIEIDSYDKDAKRLYAQGDFVVHVCVLRDPVLESLIEAYGIYNVQTEVREGETRRLSTAIDLCNKFAHDLFETLDPQMELPLEEPAPWRTNKVQ